MTEEAWIHPDFCPKSPGVPFCFLQVLFLPLLFETQVIEDTTISQLTDGIPQFLEGDHALALGGIGFFPTRGSVDSRERGELRQGLLCVLSN